MANFVNMRIIFIHVEYDALQRKFSELWGKVCVSEFRVEKNDWYLRGELFSQKAGTEQGYPLYIYI